MSDPKGISIVELDRNYLSVPVKSKEPAPSTTLLNAQFQLRCSDVLPRWRSPKHADGHRTRPAGLTLTVCPHRQTARRPAHMAGVRAAVRCRATNDPALRFGRRPASACVRVRETSQVPGDQIAVRCVGGTKSLSRSHPHDHMEANMACGAGRAAALPIGSASKHSHVPCL